MKEGRDAYCVVSLICAVFGIFILAIVFEPLAVLFGALGVSSKNAACKTLSILGIVLGGVCTAIWLINIAALASMV